VTKFFEGDENFIQQETMADENFVQESY